MATLLKVLNNLADIKSAGVLHFASELRLARLQAEIANGMYKKPIELLAKEIHYDPLPDDVRVIVIQSWKNFGMLPPATVEAMVPKQVDATIRV
jgi:hypothetical protein